MVCILPNPVMAKCVEIVLPVQCVGAYQDVNLNRIIPLAVHGDDAEAHRRRSFSICTFGSLLVKGSFWDTKLLSFCTDVSQCSSETTHQLELWLTWSLLELQLGEFLDVDPWGQPYPPFLKGRSGKICGEWKAVLVAHKGDERYMQKSYRPLSSWVSDNVCLVCAASQTQEDLLYTQFGPSALHRSSMTSTKKFIQDISQVQTFTALPGWHIFCVQFDLLHVCDLAIIPECAASALYLS